MSKKKAVGPKKRGKNWEAEFHVDNKEIVFDSVKNRENVFINKCQGSTVAIKNKCNQIAVERCDKVEVGIEGGQIGTFTILYSNGVTTNCTEKQGSYDITASTDVTLNMAAEHVKDSAFVINGCRNLHVAFADKDHTLPEELVSTVGKEGKITTACAELGRTRTEATAKHGDEVKDLGPRDKGRILDGGKLKEIKGEGKHLLIGQYKKSVFKIDSVDTLVLDTLDSCKFNVTDAVKSIEMYNCKSAYLNLPDKDKCEGLKIFTHGCSATNVIFDGDDSHENALPEQIMCSVDDKGALVAGVVEHLAPS